MNSEGIAFASDLEDVFSGQDGPHRSKTLERAEQGRRSLARDLALTLKEEDSPDHAQILHPIICWAVE